MPSLASALWRATSKHYHERLIAAKSGVNMNNFSRSVCLLVYALAIASYAVSFSDGVATTVRYGALILLVAHAIAVVVGF